MQLGVISLFPEMFAAVTGYGVVGKAISQGVLSVAFWNPRDFTTDKHRTVDDRPYGGGPGMVMKAEPLKMALDAAKAQLGADTKVIALSPQGRPIHQAMFVEASQQEALILIAGRYEGIDERLIEHCIDEEWSLGDYVLSGGEIPAMAVIDGVARMIPGVLGDEASAEQDSFMQGLLDCPHYTRPEVFEGQAVPAVLLGGDHEAIRRWRLKASLGRTWSRRPDLLEAKALSAVERDLLAEFIAEHRQHSLGVKQ